MIPLQTLCIDGVSCVVSDLGPRTAEAVVFVHGNPGALDDWDALAAELSPFTRVLAMDMPGYGRADRPRHFDYTVAGYAAYLQKLLAALGVARAHLVLHDFGGPWGLTFAAAHPERVASLTLINTGVLPGYRWHLYARIWQTPILGELFQLLAGERGTRAALNRKNPRRLPEAFVQRVVSFADWGHKRAVLSLYRATRDVEVAHARVSGLYALSVPVCVIWGAADPYLPVVYAERQKALFPGAEVHVLEGFGHWPFVDDPAAVGALLTPFLRRVVSKGQEWLRDGKV
jgi:pimeloyl-ACP methyl ester carboxylesterase